MKGVIRHTGVVEVLFIGERGRRGNGATHRECIFY
jgi:hypothetical protein